MSAVEVTLGLLADAANRTEDGKLNVLGVFDTFRANQAPAVHPQAIIVLRFTARSTELNEPRKVRIVFRAADGQELWQMEGTLILSGDAPEGHTDLIVPVHNLTLPQFGDYDFLIMIDKDVKRTIQAKFIKVDLPNAKPN